MFEANSSLSLIKMDTNYNNFLTQGYHLGLIQME